MKLEILKKSTMKNTLVLILMLFISKICISQIQINEIYNGLQNNKVFSYKSATEGCLEINKSSIKQSYDSGCEKPLNFTINSMSLKGKAIINLGVIRNTDNLT